MAVSDTELSAWIESELANAEGYDSTELAQVRKAALASYYGTGENNPALPGRSDARSQDVADMIESILATMLPGFANDHVCEFEPLDSDDVQSAAMESDVVNDVIIEQNRGYCTFQSSIRDALLLRNGWIKVWEDSRERVTTERFKDVPVEAYAQIMTQKLPPNVTRESINEKENGELISFTVRQIVTDTKVKVTSVDPCNMSWQANYPSIFLQDIRFLNEDFYPTRSELIEQGYDKEKVNAARAADWQGNTYNGRNPDGQTSSFQPPDKSMENLAAHWIHYRYDSDGDGVAELHRILYLEGDRSGSICENEIVGFLPYATGTPFLQPHRLSGLGVWDKLHFTEDNKTEILRQWIDNLSVNNNSRTAINERAVVLEDVVNSRPGGVIRVNGEVGVNIMPFPTVDTGMSALAALEYQDKIRSERGGASLDLQTSGQVVGAETAHGIERQISSREQLAGMMTRTLAETLIRETYILCHAGMREWINFPVRAQVAGEFVETVPAQWPERDRVNVQTGLSYGERGQRRRALEMVIQQQEKLAAGGYAGVLVSAENYHSAMMDWSRAADIDNASRYFLDPQSPESQQAAEAQREESKELQDLQLQIAATAAAADQQSSLIEQAMAKYKADTESAFKYWSETLGAEIETLKLTAASTEAAALMAQGERQAADAQRRADQGATSNGA